MTTVLMTLQMVAILAAGDLPQDPEVHTRPADPVGRARFDSLCAIGELVTGELPPSRTTDPDGFARWRDDPKKVWLQRAIISSAAVGREEASTVGYLVNAAGELGSRVEFLTGPYLTIKRTCDQALSSEANP